MCSVQALINRQVGNYFDFNFDDILKRFVVKPTESFQALRNENAIINRVSPILACQYAQTSGFEHILALGIEDGRVALHNKYMVNRDCERTIETFQCHNNSIFDLVWMPGSMKFVTASADRTTCLWDLGNGVPRHDRQFTYQASSVRAAAFPQRSASLFAMGARNGSVSVWDPRVASVEPALILQACHDHRPRASSGTTDHFYYRPPSSIMGLAFRNDVSLWSCGDSDGNLKLWDLRRGYSAHCRTARPAHVLPYPGVRAKCGYTSLLVDDCGVHLYANCTDNAVYCFNVASQAVKPEHAHLGHVNTNFYIKMCLSPDGQYLVSGSDDGYAYVWNVRRSQPMVRLAGHRAEVLCAAWRRCGDVELVTCSGNGSHKMWSIGDTDEAAPSGRAEPAPPLVLDHSHDPTYIKHSLADMLAMREESKRLQSDATTSSSTTGLKRCAPAEPPARCSLRLQQRHLRRELENLPNYVATGDAPHLLLMSPPKRRRVWLTRAVQKRWGSPLASSFTTANKKPHHRNSPKRKNPALLKKLNIDPKEKPK